MRGRQARLDAATPPSQGRHQPKTGGSVSHEFGPAVRSAAESVPLDWPNARAYLAAHGHALEIEPPPRQFAGGLANLNYLIRLDGNLAVLRRPPLGELPAGSYDMAREHR